MIRQYIERDKPALLHMLRLNTPAYFDVAEEQDYSEYLDRHIEDYFVVEQNDIIVGAGGINYFTDENLARISWDIIHPDQQGRGLGKMLTLYRINQIKNKPGMHFIVVRTTQLVYPFYEKLGFELLKTEKNFWAKGLDLYHMQMAIR